MNSRTTRQFRELLLPAQVRAQAREAYLLFRNNPSHPSLRFKKVHPEPPSYSARVGIGYRDERVGVGLVIVKLTGTVARGKDDGALEVRVRVIACTEGKCLSPSVLKVK